MEASEIIIALRFGLFKVSFDVRKSLSFDWEKENTGNKTIRTICFIDKLHYLLTPCDDKYR
jgi:hypothetical protein